MLSKNLVEKGLAAGALLTILWTLYVRYVPQDTRKEIRNSKTGRTVIDIIVFVGTPIFVHSMAWGTLLLTLIVTAIVSFFLSWTEIKEILVKKFGKKQKILEEEDTQWPPSPELPCGPSEALPSEG